MISYGDDWEYARSRLRDSVVLLDKKPVYICDVENGGTVEYNQLCGEPGGLCNLEDLYLQPFKLGFVNTKEYAVFSYRVPVRYYKQGLTANTFGISKLLNKKLFVNLFSKEVERTILGCYPSLFDVYERVLYKDVHSMAFSRDFSLYRSNDDIKMSYRCHEVGDAHFVGDKQVNLKLDENFSFLKEVLEGSVNAG